MGGKSKQARVKNNAKPSNSSRSAELLGNSLPPFLGFSVQSELKPFASGFSDNVVDWPDVNIDPQLQLILRKMSKKDPVTKVKALHEFTEQINAYDVESVKAILPLWPKLYTNLANDVDHRVREGAQEVMNIIADKCKKSVAPYLKQLVPIWLASSFDNYAPAASTASTSFKTTFGNNANKVREVCIYCQNDIVEYTVRNLTFHTATTLSSTKNCTPEEAEQKYQRVVSCSLKTLAYFFEVTSDADIGKIQQTIRDMLANPKFWSFSKSKVIEVKASWFAVLCLMMQNISLEIMLSQHKTQIVNASFQNIDESDPLIAPHVWACILLVQSKYDDWYDIINMKKAVLPKLSSLLRNGCNKNANAICLNLLPFLSKLSQEALNDTKLNDFQKHFFDDIKLSLTTIEISSKSEYSAITKAYFECLRYVIQHINTAIQEKSADINVDTFKSFAKSLLNENIINLLTWCLASDSKFVMVIIQQTSLLHAYWASHAKESKLYAELLDTFWSETITFIIDGLANKINEENFFDHVIEFSEELYFSYPRIENQKVKFAIEEMSDNTNESNQVAKINDGVKNDNSTKVPTTLKNTTSTAYIESNLKNLVIQLVRVCLLKSANEMTSNYVFKIQKLIKMFHDADFYAQISEERTVMSTLDSFLNIMENLEVAACEDCIDIIFDILSNQTIEESLKFIQNKLLKIKNSAIQKPVLNRLLSHPLNNEPEVRTILSQSDSVNIITNLAKNVLENDSKDSLNLLRKCFFQNDEGLIAIDSNTADSILKILAQPLTAKADSKLDHLMDVCGSFISQIMPVICSEDNCSPGMQREIFLTLFRFSIEHTPDDFISEDTLWEITTSWQDSLSSQDILADMSLFHQCKEIVKSSLQAKTMTIDLIETIADAITQYVICSTEHIQDEKERFENIDLIVDEFFMENDDLNANTNRMQEFCLFLEALQCKVSIGWELNDDCMENMDMFMTFRHILLNTCIIYKLVSKSDKMTRYCAMDGSYADEEDLNEKSNDLCNTKAFVLKKWSSNLYNETLRCINVASVGDALLNILSQVEENLETTIVQLSEKVKMLLRQGNEEFLTNLKDRMLAQAASEVNGAATRFLLYLVNINQYEQFEENASILLWEDLSEYLVSNNALKAFANTLQYILPNLTSKAITMHMPIMSTNPSAIWIKAAVFRCLIENNFNSDYNEKSDQNIIAHVLKFLVEVSEKQLAYKESLLYNVEIQKKPFESVTDAVEIINILKVVIQKFPYELTIKNWDAIRIGLSSWVLSVSKSIDHVKNPQVALFLATVFELYAALANFINNEKQKSSTEFLNNVIDEWENLFAREVNIVLFKAYFNLVEEQEKCASFSVCYNKILEVIAPAMELLNYGAIFTFYKTLTKVTSDNVLNFLLKNLSNSLHCVRAVCGQIIKLMTQYYVALDIETYEKKIENLNINTEVGDWHFLSKFEDYIGRYEIPICKYLDEFSFKLTEIAELKSIDRNEALAYFFLWDCIIYVCANSPITLRSLYTSWLHEKRYEENLLHFLFRAMPAEILKNHDSKIMITDAFKGLTLKQIQDPNLAVEKYACHLYTEVLRKLPAVVRKWWNTCQSRQKTFIDKMTTNFVSPIICCEELKAIGNKKERHENMQVTVHNSTREVFAVYSIDEARMELVITLAPNYPLGSVKVDSGKQIGGRLSSRNTGMQLTIFLTHQNGSIFDGLTLWKNNLDKKFEGVEECYVCYTVIHQDTCQLPKLTCKTCRKKFHGPCLYKWFTTSSKSTCPICRNIF